MNSVRKLVGVEMICSVQDTPRGIRIPVTSVKGRCPRPLDDGGHKKLFYSIVHILI